MSLMDRLGSLNAARDPMHRARRRGIIVPVSASASIRLSPTPAEMYRRLPESLRRSKYHFASLAPSGYVKDVTEISPLSMSLRYWPEMRW